LLSEFLPLDDLLAVETTRRRAWGFHSHTRVRAYGTLNSMQGRAVSCFTGSNSVRRSAVPSLIRLSSQNDNASTRQKGWSTGLEALAQATLPLSGSLNRILLEASDT
jgi:hypothetical protein